MNKIFDKYKSDGTSPEEQMAKSRGELNRQNKLAFALEIQKELQEKYAKESNDKK